MVPFWMTMAMDPYGSFLDDQAMDPYGFFLDDHGSWPGSVTELEISALCHCSAGNFSSVGVHEGPPPRRSQEGPGGARKSPERARKSPLATAHQRKFDERYSSIFPYSRTDEKLPCGDSHHMKYQ